MNKGSVEKIEAHNKRSEDRKLEEQKKSMLSVTRARKISNYGESRN